MAALRTLLAGLGVRTQSSFLFKASSKSPVYFSHDKVINRKSHIIRKEDPEEKIVMADGGDTIVCWHPARPFPYECSLPLPTKTNDVNKVLKIEYEDIKDQFMTMKPQLQREYLMKVTSTTKHRWFPHNGKKFAKNKTKPDREYL